MNSFLLFEGPSSAQTEESKTLVSVYLRGVYSFRKEIESAPSRANNRLNLSEREDFFFFFKYYSNTFVK